jgi:D-alanyl-D-alanine carboxypeptidase (penicillin-binding protein 5/6)
MSGSKKVIVQVWFVVALSLLSMSVSAQAQVLIPAPPQIAAKSWILVDANTGKVIVEKSADLSLPPASLTKMMTSYVVAGELKSGKISSADQVLISVNAWQKGGSKMFVREGTEVDIKDLIRGVIIQSGNDATIALAEHVAGSESAFADVMNQQAVLLGMTNSNYINATGWPAEGHLTTARDLSLLARALIRDYPDHYRLYSEKHFEYNGIKQLNRNRLLWRDKSVDGIKTGHTEAAGYCLVASAVRDDMRLIAVVMGTNSEEARAQETQKLLSYGFRYYETTQIYSEGGVLRAGNQVWFGKEDVIDLIVGRDIFLTIPRGAVEQLEATIHVDEIIRAPFSEKAELGRLVVAHQGQQLLDVPLLADHAIEEAGFFSRLWDHLALFIKSLFS